MAEETKRDFGPDPDLYARMSAPFATKGVADDAIGRFMLGVRALREECGVAEIIMIAIAYFADDGGERHGTCMSMELGGSHAHPHMGAMAYKIWTGPAVLRAKELERIAMGKALDEDEVL